MSQTVGFRKLRRHFEGWQVGAIVVGSALLIAAVVVPRPVEDAELPLPFVDRAAQERLAEDEAARAQKAYFEPLPFDVRAIGEAFRRYGRLEAAGSPETGEALSDLRLRAHQLKGRERERLRGLLALQTELFLSAVRTWEGTGRTPPALLDLGGDFLTQAERNGWVVAGRIVFDRHERRALFHVRWVSLTSYRTTAGVAPSQNQWRTYYRALLEHPPAFASPEQRARQALELVSALAAHDSSYPLDLARGLLLYELRQYPAAANALEQFLASKHQHRWKLRARNHLVSVRLAAERSTR